MPQLRYEPFNGVGCMAAWLIGHLKGGKIGNVSMTADSPENDEATGAEYHYVLNASTPDSRDREGVPISVDVRAKSLGRWKSLWSGLLADADMGKIEQSESD